MRYFGGPSLVWLENSRATDVTFLDGVIPDDPYTFYRHDAESFL